MTSAPFQKNSIKNQSSLIPLTLFILLVLSGLIYWWHVNPLTSDEKMIAHFYEHRAEIEKLVKSYQNWEPSIQIPNWAILPKNKALLEKAKIKRLKDLVPVWHPNSYSVEAEKQFSALIRVGKIRNIKPYSSIGVELVDGRRPDQYLGWVLISSGPQVIFKELAYFPEIPKIEQGKMWWPVDGKKGHWRADRVFSTLNDYPPDWKKGECVYRQIEPQWFIRMCVAAV